MRIIHFLFLVSLVCIVSAKYLPGESAPRALLRNKRSSESENTVESQSNERDDDENANENDDDSLERNETIEKKLRKHSEEQRKLQENIEKKELEEKLTKEELKRQEQERKRLETLEKKTVESKNKPVTSEESGEDLDFEDIWENYILYEKYGLTEASTNLEKEAVMKRYTQEKLNINANSTESDYRQAILHLLQNKLVTESGSQSGFRNYLVSHVNTVYIQELQNEIENKIAELNNDTVLLENVSLPWVPEAKQIINEKKTILTSIAQFLSNVIPNWISGKPVTETTNTDSTANSASSADSVVNSNEGPASVPITVSSNTGSKGSENGMVSGSNNFDKPSIDGTSIDAASSDKQTSTATSNLPTGNVISETPEVSSLIITSINFDGSDVVLSVAGSSVPGADTYIVDVDSVSKDTTSGTGSPETTIDNTASLVTSSSDGSTVSIQPTINAISSVNVPVVPASNISEVNAPNTFTIDLKITVGTTNDSTSSSAEVPVAGLYDVTTSIANKGSSSGAAVNQIEPILHTMSVDPKVTVNNKIHSDGGSSSGALTVKVGTKVKSSVNILGMEASSAFATISNQGTPLLISSDVAPSTADTVIFNSNTASTVVDETSNPTGTINTDAETYFYGPKAESVSAANIDTPANAPVAKTNSIVTDTVPETIYVPVKVSINTDTDAINLETSVASDVVPNNVNSPVANVTTIVLETNNTVDSIHSTNTASDAHNIATPIASDAPSNNIVTFIVEGHSIISEPIPEATNNIPVTVSINTDTDAVRVSEVATNSVVSVPIETEVDQPGVINISAAPTEAVTDASVALVTEAELLTDLPAIEPASTIDVSVVSEQSPIDTSSTVAPFVESPVGSNVDAIDATATVAGPILDDNNITVINAVVNVSSVAPTKPISAGFESSAIIEPSQAPSNEVTAPGSIIDAVTVNVDGSAISVTDGTPTASNVVSINDVTIAPEINSPAPDSVVETEASSNVVNVEGAVVTQIPQVLEEVTNTLTVPAEVGASLLEVMQR